MKTSHLLISVFCLLGTLSEAAHAQPQGLQQNQKAPSAPVVQGFPGLTPAQMKMITEHSKKVQECLQTEGKEPLKRIQLKNIDNGKKLKALCLAGKNERARELAIEQAKETAESDDMKIITKCRTIQDEMSKLFPQPGKQKYAHQQDPETYLPKDICSHIKR